MSHLIDDRDIYVDPVSHEYVDATHDAGRSFYRGHMYHFTDAVNKQIFERDPELWVSIPHASMNSANVFTEDE